MMINMKKIFISGMCVLMLFGCGSKDAVSEITKTDGTEEMTEETAAGEKLTFNDFVYDEIDLAVDTNMPPIISEGDMLACFYQPCNRLLDDIVNTLLWNLNSEQHEDFNSLLKINRLLAPSNLNQYLNTYSTIKRYQIPEEYVLSVIEEDVRASERLGMTDEITMEDIDVILHGSEAEIIERFASEYSIGIGNRIYSPQWMYLHTPEQFIQVGITKEMVREKIAAYSKIPLPYDARIAFQDKISDFLEEEIIFDDTYINENYGGMFYKFKGQTITVGDEEYGMSWLSSRSIQAYERAGITTDMLEDLLERIADQSDTKEYEWIHSCLVRMKEME